jgi:hypothetical protein
MAENATPPLLEGRAPADIVRWRLHFDIDEISGEWIVHRGSASWTRGADHTQLNVLFARITKALGNGLFEELSAEKLLSHFYFCCGKPLTDPASMARRIGPECFGSSSLRVPFTIKAAGRIAMSTLTAIETHHRDYRFRSRLEARTVVFLDAISVEWKYEKEGYTITHRDGSTRRYLLDFRLPKFKTFVEVKPDWKEGEAVRPLLQAMSEASDNEHAVLLISGSPDVNRPPTMTLFMRGKSSSVRSRQCPFCSAITFVECACTPGITVTKAPEEIGRIKWALGEAQQARFEHGETSRPYPVANGCPWLGQRRVVPIGHRSGSTICSEPSGLRHPERNSEPDGHTHIHRASQVLSDTQGTLAKSHFTKVGDRDDRKIRSK